MTDFTKQVGWSPGTPASPASITVATDNGDGTGYITNPDGTIVPVVTTPSVDTFSTIVGSTITDPNGNSITVPAGSTYDAATSTITTSDGNSVDLSSFDTDTDTFAKLSGNVITFANGDTLDVTPSVDTNVSAVALEWDTDRLRSTVTEDGSVVVGELVIPDGVREDGDKTLMVDPVTGELELKDACYNPVVDVDCSSTHATYKFCSGSELNVSQYLRAVVVSGVGINIDDTTAVDTVVYESSLRTVDIGSCGARLLIEHASAYDIRPANANGGFATFLPEYTLDGGATWIALNTGGFDIVSAESSVTEISFHDVRETALLTAGSVVAGTRIRLDSNDLLAGSSISVESRQTGVIKYIQTVCC